MKLLVVSVLASMVLGQEPEPLGNNNFSRIIRLNPSGNYQLVEDIILTEPHIPIGNLFSPFTGTLDGQGHVIKGLNAITTADNTPAGLFGFIKNARVRRLMLDRPYVLTTGSGSPAGAVAGEMEHSNVTNTVIHRAQVETRGDIKKGNKWRYSSAGCIAGWMKSESRVENNLAIGSTRTNGSRGYAAIGVGYMITNSLFYGNQIIGDARTNGRYAAAAGGAVGWVKNRSRVSRNLVIGDVSMNGSYAAAGGAVGWVENNSRVSRNLAIGDVRTNGTDSSAGVGGGEVFSSRFDDNLVIGDACANGTRTPAGGAVARRSMVLWSAAAWPLET